MPEKLVSRREEKSESGSRKIKHNNIESDSVKPYQQKKK